MPLAGKEIPTSVTLQHGFGTWVRMTVLSFCQVLGKQFLTAFPFLLPK